MQFSLYVETTSVASLQQLFLAQKELANVVLTMVTRLDYCNSVFLGFGVLTGTESCNRDVDWSRLQGPSRSNLCPSALISPLFMGSVQGSDLTFTVYHGLGPVHMKDNLLPYKPIQPL